MKKIIIAAFFVLTPCLASWSQHAKQWSLEECIQHAIDHNINIQQLKLQKEGAEVELNTAKMSRLPDLNAGISQTWNFGRSNNNQVGIYVDQSISNSNFNLSSSTPLFTGFRISNQIKKSQLDLQAAIQNMEKAKEDLSLSVASLFLTALFNQEILKVSEQQLLFSQTKVKRTESLVEVGKVPASQLYDIKAEVAKDEVTVTESKNNLKISLLDLAQSLELERSADFDVQAPQTDDVVDNGMGSLLSPGMIYENAISIKPVIKTEEYKLESSKRDYKIAQSGYMPNLNLSLGYGNNYYHDYNSDKNLSFNEQFKNNGGEYIGLNLSIPIFNRFDVRNRVKSARLGIQNQQLELESVKKKLYKEIQTAYLNAVASQSKYYSSTKAVEASQESFKYANERYETGKSSVFEFNEAKTSLIKTLSDQIQAKYEYIFQAKILDFYNGIPIKL